MQPSDQTIRLDAERLGLFYNGPQFDFDGQFLFHTVTDLQIGSFSVRQGASVADAHQQFLARFAQLDQESRAQHPARA